MKARTERVRVLHCLSTIAAGGVERRRLILARELDPERYEQRMICRGAEGGIAAELERAGVPVMTVGMGRLFEPSPLVRALRIARAFRPHIVHGAVFEGIGVAVVAGRACGAKVVTEETSHAVNRSRRGHALFRVLVAASDACVAISPAVGEYLETVTGVPRRKITVITNGVIQPTLPSAERRAALWAELGLAHDAFVLGTVARMNDDSHKRISDLVRTLAILRDEIPGLVVLAVGGGPQQEQMRALARELGVSDRFMITGIRENVGDYYSLMDVFALVSAREGFGLVAPEAMMCGLPVIATAVGGLKDIVRHEVTGLLVPPLSPESIAAAVRRMHDARDWAKRLGEAGRARAREHYSEQRYAAEVDAFYQRLLAR